MERARNCIKDGGIDLSVGAFYNRRQKPPNRKPKYQQKRELITRNGEKKIDIKIEQYNLKHWSNKIHQQSVPAY